MNGELRTRLPTEGCGVDERYSITVFERRLHGRNTRVTRLVGDNRFGETFGDEDGLAVTERVETKDRLVVNRAVLSGDLVVIRGVSTLVRTSPIARMTCLPEVAGDCEGRTSVDKLREDESYSPDR